MIFQLALTIPANTTAVAGMSAELPILPGYVERVWVGFPHGCFGLARVQLWRGESQLLPLTGGEVLAWNNIVYDFPMHYRVDDEPLRFIVRAWNYDESYAHTVTVMVSVRPFEPGEAGEIGGLTVEEIYAGLGV